MSLISTKRKRSNSSSDELNDGSNKSNDIVIELTNFEIDIMADSETIRIFEGTFQGSDSRIILDEDLEEETVSKFNNLVRDVVLKKLYRDHSKNDHIDSNEVLELSEPSETPEQESGENDIDNDDMFSYSTRRYPQVGDRVSVNYIPASQKYIDHYASQSFYGEVFFVDSERDNFFMWRCDMSPMIDGRIELTYRIQSYKREGCHFFGMSDCYFGDYSFY